MKNYFAAIGLILFALSMGCTKGPGEGGRASITGSVFATNYSNNFVPVDSGMIGGLNVYIKYGDQAGIGDNTDTDQFGVFKFNYLREGDYSIIVYTKRKSNNTLDSAIVVPVKIDSRKQQVELPVIKINTLKN